MRRDSMPKLQNIPIPLTEEQRKTAQAIRRAFIPVEAMDRILNETDYSSIEIRLAALYGFDVKGFK